MTTKNIQKCDEVFRLPLDEIKVNDRLQFRSELGDLEGLKASMAYAGQINPVIITPDKKLIAGRRRLKAARELKWSNILARVMQFADPTLCEFDENVHRLNYSVSEFVKIAERVRPTLAAIRKEYKKQKGKGDLPLAVRVTKKGEVNVLSNSGDKVSIDNLPFDDNMENLAAMVMEGSHTIIENALGEKRLESGLCKIADIGINKYQLVLKILNTARSNKTFNELLELANSGVTYNQLKREYQKRLISEGIAVKGKRKQSERSRERISDHVSREERVETTVPLVDRPVKPVTNISDIDIPVPELPVITLVESKEDDPHYDKLLLFVSKAVLSYANIPEREDDDVVFIPIQKESGLFIKSSKLKRAWKLHLEEFSYDKC